MSISLVAQADPSEPVELDRVVSWEQVIQPRTRQLLAELLARDALLCPVPVAIYARISMDKEQDARGVARQIDAAVERIHAEPTWRLPAPPFVDNDMSASKGLPRPEYARLMAAVGRGEARVLVVKMTGRMWRNRKERAQGMEHLGKHLVRVIATGGQDLDLSTSSGRVITGILGELDTYETEQMSERLRDEAVQRAKDGLPSGARSYGYTATGEIIQDEADIIRACVDRLLDTRRDTSVRALVLELQAANVPTVRGGTWSPTTVRAILRNPALAGLRTFKGEVVAPGRWEPIISEQTHARLLARLRAASLPAGWSARSKHLLSNIATCGKCGCGLLASAGTKYVCPPRERGGCRGVGRNMAALDAYVETIVVDLLSTPEILAALVREDMADPLAAVQAAADVEAAQARAAALGAAMAGDDPADEVTRIMRKTQAETIRVALTAARARQAALVEATVFEGLGGVTPAEMAAHWASLALQRRRTLIRAMVTVTVLPGRRGLSTFDPTAVRVERRTRVETTTR
ncbi:recombinase family protein [Frankia sp. AgB1.9]|uniref:recombinase family protein n=1 Tax=unclassified Frankia TaxID=2632575 RepID=UPI0019318B60|nr:MULTISPECIES: recombinase family protein [unclassified Frankia]MBL7493139.1 recombinase family protein [Frankia sp. AgW1.1]MBL7547747.1 recombinase family protein [Frankia sp. AgB1.9]MBL7618065.1 recombinase family protein [Frankia sp. AgB1.8]